MWTHFAVVSEKQINMRSKFSPLLKGVPVWPSLLAELGYSETDIVYYMHILVALQSLYASWQMFDDHFRPSKILSLLLVISFPCSSLMVPEISVSAVYTDLSLECECWKTEISLAGA